MPPSSPNPDPISDPKTSFFSGAGHISICYMAYIREYTHPLGMTRTMYSLLVLLSANLVSLFNLLYFFFPFKGKQEKSVMKKLKEYEGLLKKRCESYEKLKKEVEEQLQIHQKLQDNLLAGFLVGFVIMVLICMLPRTLLASG